MIGNFSGKWAFNDRKRQKKFPDHSAAEQIR